MRLRGTARDLSSCTRRAAYSLDSAREGACTTMAMSSRSPNSLPYSTQRMMYGRSWGRRSRGDVLNVRVVIAYTVLRAASAVASPNVHHGRATESRTSRRRNCPVVENRGNGARLLFAGDEPLEALPGGVVRPLLRRGLHEVRRGRGERALEPAVEGELARADGVDHHARGVWRVPDLEFQLDVDGLVSEAAPLQADVGPLA